MPERSVHDVLAQTLAAAASRAADETLPLVRLEHASVRFGDVCALRGVDFVLRRGERVALVGANGSGKTTLLRLLMTLERPTDGVIWVEGEPLWHRYSGRATGGRVPLYAPVEAERRLALAYDADGEGLTDVFDFVPVGLEPGGEARLEGDAVVVGDGRDPHRSGSSHIRPNG